MAEVFGIACYELVSLDFRFGSGSDSIATALARLLLREKRKSPSECRLSGEERTSIETSGTSLVSQYRTPAPKSIAPRQADLVFAMDRL